ncbi:hypothetical protein ACIOMM_05235 [Streptomyces sp. NPDC087908]|uniref:hypothetical protein n=1 Tax=Streptomyces sp. NPDC087908 TaxID=3365820 RepID=UPI00380BA296
MKLAITIHRARLGPTEFKVIRPAHPLVHAVLIDRDRWLDVFLDQDAAQRVGALWELAASSPRSLVHVPMRRNHTPTGQPNGDAERQLDLVLVHHSLQFAPSRWKELRGRLDRGRPQTVTLADAAGFDESGIDHEARHYRENRDLFHQHLHAETLFMTGSAAVFRDTAPHFHDVARNGPGHTPARPGDSHFCSTLHANAGILGNAREIHLQYCDDWGSPSTAGPASPELAAG